MQRGMQYVETDFGGIPTAGLRLRTAVGGSRPNVQAASGASSSSLLAKIYRAPAVAGIDAKDDPRYGVKGDMVDNVYLPAPQPQRADPNRVRAFFADFGDWLKGV